MPRPKQKYRVWWGFVPLQQYIEIEAVSADKAREAIAHQLNCEYDLADNEAIVVGGAHLLQPNHKEDL